MRDLYVPQPAVILDIKEENFNTKTFTLRFQDPKVQESFTFEPGQFVQVSLPYIGEAPISLSSSPTEKGSFKLCIRRVGNVTNAIHRLRVGDLLWIRGPYGRGFPFDEVKGRNVLAIAGGIGLAPLRSVVNRLLHYKEEFGEIYVLYGDRNPSLLLFREDREVWARELNLRVICEAGDETWKGPIGVVTKLLEDPDIPVENTVAMVCGPPIMYKFVCRKLVEMGFKEEDIYLSFERRMKCGVGKCRHCNIGPKFVCLHGPVFTLKEARELHEAGVM
ncbi:MAG: FAD/NAD(P)-binding protein [Candidatus Hecatellaceae archaeon]